MADPIFTPMLIGAGVGALGGVATGNNPFKTALLGGALGTGYGALGGTAGLGGAASGIGGATATGGATTAGLATGAGTAAAGTGISQAALLGSSALPASLGGAGLTAAETGLATGLGSSAAGTGIALGDIAGSSALPASLGGIGATAAEGAGITNLAQYANMSPSELSLLSKADPSLLDKLKPYANIQNLSGAMNIADKFKPKPPQFITADTKGVTKGQAPQSGGLIMSMDELMKLSQLQRSQPISLLVG